MKTQRIASLLSFASVLALAACNSEREVETKGEVSLPAGSSAQAVLLEFYDIPKEEGATEKKVDTLMLDKPGAFTRTVSVGGDKIRIFALADADKDGKCTQGEAWASAELRIKEDDSIEAPAVLELKTIDCPK